MPSSTSGRVLVTTDVPHQKTAWTKARADVMALAIELGYAVLPLPPGLSPLAWKRFAGELSARVGAGGVVLLEYPFEQRRRLYPLFSYCRLKGIRLHGLIHDLHALRFGVPASRELAILRLFDGLVSHNPVMSQWLQAQGYAGALADLQLFDYLLQGPALSPPWHACALEAPLKVVSAGNLSCEKAGYIYDARLGELQGVELSLFGAFFEPRLMPPSPVKYKGVFDPATPALDDHYHFGLVWDGQSAHGCEGGYGQYMRYNNPHKVSLYAALGLPVVVWEASAVARFVLDQGVGIAVADLRELAQVPQRLSNTEYLRMATRMRTLQADVTQGRFLRRALAALDAA